MIVMNVTLYTEGSDTLAMDVEVHDEKAESRTITLTRADAMYVLFEAYSLWEGELPFGQALIDAVTYCHNTKGILE